MDQLRESGPQAQYLKALEQLRQLAMAHGDQDTALLMRVRHIFATHDHAAIDKSINALNVVRSKMSSHASLRLREALARVYGNLYIDSGSFQLALQHQLQALDLERQLPHGALQASLYRLGTIAELYNAMQLPAQSLKFADEGLRQAQGKGLSHNRASLLAARTLALTSLGRYAEADKALDQAEQLNQNDPDPFRSTRLLAIRASLNLAQGKLAEADSSIARLQSLAKHHDNHYYLVKARMLHGQAAILHGDVAQGSQTMHMAIAEYQHLGQTVDVLDGVQRLITALEARKAWPQVVNAMQERSGLWVKLYRRGQTHAIAEEQAKHKALQREKHISALTAQLKLQEAKQDFDHLLLALIASLALLAIVVALLLLQSRQRTRRERDKLSHAVRHDPLTGAMSRYAFEQRYGHLAPTDAIHPPCSVLLLDLDEFKSINDQHGHDAGDAALKSVVERIHGSLQAGEQLYRWGGEEFLLIYPQRPPAPLRQAIIHLLSNITDTPHTCNGKAIRITVSGGLAPHPQTTGNQAPLADAIRWADAALYAAKQAGRQRVIHVTPTIHGQEQLKGHRPVDMVQLLDWERHDLVKLESLSAS